MSESTNAVIQMADGAVFEVSEDSAEIDVLIHDADTSEELFIEVTGRDGETQRINIDLIQRYRDKPGRNRPDSHQ